jgi:hypothetical protein
MLLPGHQYRLDYNGSNRSEIANQINGLLSPDPETAGPFWCASPEAAYRYIPQKRPPQPFQTAQGYQRRILLVAAAGEAAVMHLSDVGPQLAL